MTIVAISFLILLTIGVPVGFSLGISGLFYFLQHTNLQVSTIVQLPVTQAQSIQLLAVPLFIFAGSLLNYSGITHRLVDFSMTLTGHMKGGLAQVSVVLSTLMGGVSGSSIADAAMESRILGPQMEKQGYPKGFTGSVIGFTSIITATIPPAIGLIIYGTVGNVSIGKLFAGGLVAGLVMFTIMMIGVAIMSRIRGFKPAKEKKSTFKEIMLSLKENVWALIFPIMLLVGIRFGLFTPTEIGAFACVYAFIVGAFIYKELDIKSLIKAFKEAIFTIGTIMYMIVMSAVFGYGIPLDRVPQKMTAFLSDFTTSPLIILLISLLMLTIFGMFMEGSIVIIILTPILLPVVVNFGIDPVFFGIVLAMTIVLGTLTPPVGLGMYTILNILDLKLEDFLKENIPFYFVFIVIMAILIMFPSIILFLPNLLFS